jgi:hypothetical protein
MELILTSSNIMFALGILGTIFTVYHYFRNPQINSDKKDALLAQQVGQQAESVERRFKDAQDSFNALLLQSNNHIHTVDTKVETLSTNMNIMSNEITRLATIIEERIPKR